MRAFTMMLLSSAALAMGQPCQMQPPQSSGDAAEPAEPDPFCRDADLNGYWRREGGVEVAIVQNGATVNATYLRDRTCDHRDDMGTTTTTRDDFSGMVDGCIISGKVLVCGFGCTGNNCPLSENGWQEASYTAGVDPEGTTITLEWTHPKGNGTNTYTKRDCRPKDASDWGLPTDREWNREDQFGGSIQDQVIYSAVNDCSPAGFNAGVFGTVTRVNAGPMGFDITITLPDGGTIALSSGSPPGVIAVSVGDDVSPTTFVGSLSNPCSPGLFVNGSTPDGRDGINPDCVP